MKRCLLPLIAVVALSQYGCVSVKAGTDEGGSGLHISGLVDGYISLDGFRPYDGTILEFGLLNSARRGEVVSFDLWPLFGFGVGIVGVRTRVLLLDVGVGALFYDPHAPPPASEEPEEAEPVEEEPEATAETAREETAEPAPAR